MVDMCKKTPITKAEISVVYFEKKSRLPATKTPSGLIKANTLKKVKILVFDNLECTKNVVKTIAMGIL